MNCSILRSTVIVASLVFFSMPASANSGTENRIQEFKNGLDAKGVAHEAEPEKPHVPAKAHNPKPKEKGAAHGSHAGEPNKHAASAHHAAVLEPEEAVKRLLEGNRRYVADRSAGPNRKPARRAEVANGQNPFAIVIGCSDSRVPPELLFDQGFGDLFVIRTAGNIVDSIGLGSIEYAVDHLGVKLIVVLGHERCGAVDATIKGGEAPSHIKTLVETIKPAVDKARTAPASGGHGCDFQCKSVKANVKMVAEKIRSASPIVAEAVEDGNLRVIGAYYDLDSGETTLTYKPYL